MNISSTNGHNAENRHISDYYVTPVKDIELFLSSLAETIELDWNNIRILDLCGGGNPRVSDSKGIREIEHQMSYPLAIRNTFGECNIDTYDIRQDSYAEHKEDYLRAELDYQPEIFLRTLIQCPTPDGVENGLKQGLSADLSVLLKTRFFMPSDAW